MVVVSKVESGRTPVLVLDVGVKGGEDVARAFEGGNACPVAAVVGKENSEIGRGLLMDDDVREGVLALVAGAGAGASADTGMGTGAGVAVGVKLANPPKPPSSSSSSPTV